MKAVKDEAGKHRDAFDMFGRMLAFNSITGASSNYLLVLRGIFKETTETRGNAGDEFMKPYLRG